MAESLVLKTENRKCRGSKAARKMRKHGQVPAVVYGHKEASEPIALSHDELMSALRHGARVVDLQLAQGLQKALIRELQWDHLGKDVLHADFERVAADERIRVTVPLELRGIAPGVTAGGLLEQPLHNVEIECLAINIPHSIRVAINELQIGSSIHVNQLVVPPDVKVMTDPDAIVVQVSAPQVAPEPVAPAGEAAAAQAEPEVIGRKAAEGEEAEE